MVGIQAVAVCYRQSMAIYFVQHVNLGTLWPILQIEFNFTASRPNSTNVSPCAYPLVVQSAQGRELNYETNTTDIEMNNTNDAPRQDTMTCFIGDIISGMGGEQIMNVYFRFVCAILCASLVLINLMKWFPFAVKAVICMGVQND